METSNATMFDRFNKWLQESVMIKLASIGMLVIILLIPSVWIQNLMEEREQRSAAVMAEVASSWSGLQTIVGPVIVVPFNTTREIETQDGKKQTRSVVEKAFFLPETFDVKGSIAPEQLRRGIFDAVVYTSDLKINATFNQPDLAALNINPDDMRWAEAQLIFGVTDLRGINANPDFKFNAHALTANPSNAIGIGPRFDNNGYNGGRSNNLSDNGIIANLNWKSQSDFKGSFSVNLQLKGSSRLDFVPVGKTTNISMTSPWKDPSFMGEFLPDSREVSEAGFTANWKVLHFNRPFPQQFAGYDQNLSGSDFGVELRLPVDQYQKSIRTAKYGILVILLTFIAMFLLEITQGIRIHPFQYILIGAALIIYYTLLLSLSEHVGYNLAYAIASFSTVVLISLYSTTFLANRLTLLFAGILTGFYLFIFVIIQEQDYSLLLGSIGLFIIIAALMYFSRNIRWYKAEIQS